MAYWGTRKAITLAVLAGGLALAFAGFAMRTATSFGTTRLVYRGPTVVFSGAPADLSVGQTLDCGDTASGTCAGAPSGRQGLVVVAAWRSRHATAGVALDPAGPWEIAQLAADGPGRSSGELALTPVQGAPDELIAKRSRFNRSIVELRREQATSILTTTPVLLTPTEIGLEVRVKSVDRT